jgi:SET domain-containing protein
MPQKRSSRKTGTAKKTGRKAAKTPARKTASRRSQQLFRVGRSGIQGKGAFATRDIRKGERLGEYKGERISWEEADARYDDETQGRHHTFLFEVDDDTVIDAAVGGSAAKYINHSCDPNCEATIEHGHVFIDAVRNIKEGEELFYDYSYVLDEAHTAAVKRRYPCWCGTRKCRGTILAKKR